jgi:secreted PhoX family phosphatase
MGAFTHEAVAVDPVYKYIYQTEDVPDGNFYRFKPDIYPDGGRADFRSGTLEVAIVTGDNRFESRAVRWGKVPYPVPQLDEHRTDPAYLPTCQQVPAAEKFNGGEGCWYHDGIVYFSTKGDNRVWAMDTHKNVIDLIYDKQTQQGFYPGLMTWTTSRFPPQATSWWPKTGPRCGWW